MKPTLSLPDFEQAAKKLGTGAAEVKAVASVESNGGGFLKDGRVIIRFEPHIFHRYTKGKFDPTNPDVSFPVRKNGYPRNVDHSWQLFNEASKLDPNAAVLACSWGMFQIMAFNYSAAGCKNLTQFVERMESSEGEQLDMFCTLLLNWGLNDELQRHDWSTFARMFNGADYKSNRYDEKLAAAYTRFSKGVST